MEDDGAGRAQSDPSPIGAPRTVDAPVVRPLRMEVLRPGRPPEASAMPLDDHPLAHHVAIYLDGEVVSVGSVVPDPPPWRPEQPQAWRVRGMATREPHRGRRLGHAVLSELIQYARQQRGSFIWCNARTGAVRFYERAGFVTHGGLFMTEGIEHIEMWRDLSMGGSPGE